MEDHIPFNNEEVDLIKSSFSKLDIQYHEVLVND